MNKIILLIFWANFVTNLYEDQFGVNQWKIKHFGKIKKHFILNRQSFIISENGFGKIIDHKDIEFKFLNTKFIKYNEKKIYSLNEKGILEVYNLLSNDIINTFNTKINDPINLEIFGDSLIINDKKALYKFNLKNFSIKNELFFSEESFSNIIKEDKFFLLLTYMDNKVCLEQIDLEFKEKLEINCHQIELKDSINVDKGFIISSKNNKNYFLDKKGNLSDFDEGSILRNNNDFLIINNEKEIINWNNNKINKNNKIEKKFLYKNNLIGILENENKFNIYELKNENIKLKIAINLSNFIKNYEVFKINNFFVEEDIVILETNDLNYLIFKKNEFINNFEESSIKIKDLIFVEKIYNIKNDYFYLEEYEKLIKNKNYHTAFIFRIKNEIISIFKLTKNLYNNFDFNLIKEEILSNFDKKYKKNKKRDKETQLDIMLKKSQYIVYYTKYNNIIVINSFNGKLLDKYVFNKNKKILNLKKIKDNSFMVIYLENKIKYSIKFDIKNNKLIKNKINKVEESIDYFYKISKRVINGYIKKNNKNNLIWNINFGLNEKIIKVCNKNPDHKSHFIHSVDDKSVYYKIVDNNNFLIITQNKKNKSLLNIYIINGFKGKILAHYSNIDISLNHDINVVFDDNSFFITYFNNKKKNYEIWVFELFRNELEQSLLSMFKKYILIKKEKMNEIDYSQYESSYVINDQKYGINLSIKKIKNFDSVLGLSRRNIYLITNENLIYSIDRLLLSTRRKVSQISKKELNKKFLYSNTLPNYEYIIDVKEEKYVTKNWILNDLKNIKFGSTKFESSSLIVSYGFDMFFGIESTDKQFDILTDDFNKPFLVFIIVILILLIFVLKFYGKSKIAVKEYLNLYN